MKVFKVVSFKEECDLLPSSYKKVHTHRFTLVKLGLIEDPRESKDKYDRYVVERKMECQDATLYVQQISEAHHYDRYKRRFLYANAIEFYDGYILPADKVEVFSNSDLHPEHKNITISVSQSRIPKIGQEKVKYIVYRKEFDTEFDRATKRGIVVCRKSDYIKNHEHYGKYILVDVIRPEIMWGTIEEIESDIKGIILDRLHEDKLIDFLRN